MIGIADMYIKLMLRIYQNATRPSVEGTTCASSISYQNAEFLQPTTFIARILYLSLIVVLHIS